MKTSQRDQSRKELGGITNDDGDAIFETQKVFCLKKPHNKRPKTPQICGKEYFENSKERGEVSSSSRSHTWILTKKYWTLQKQSNDI